MLFALNAAHIFHFSADFLTRPRSKAFNFRIKTIKKKLCYSLARDVETACVRIASIIEHLGVQTVCVVKTLRAIVVRSK